MALCMELYFHSEWNNFLLELLSFTVSLKRKKMNIFKKPLGRSRTTGTSIETNKKPKKNLAWWLRISLWFASLFRRKAKDKPETCAPTFEEIEDQGYIIRLQDLNQEHNRNFDPPLNGNVSTHSGSSDSFKSDCSSDRYDEIFCIHQNVQNSTDSEREGECSQKLPFVTEEIIIFQEVKDQDMDIQSSVEQHELEKTFSSDFVTDAWFYSEIVDGNKGSTDCVSTLDIQNQCLDNNAISELHVLEASGNSKSDNKKPDKQMDHWEISCFGSEKTDFKNSLNATVQSESSNIYCCSDRYDEIFDPHQTDQFNTESESEGECSEELLFETEKDNFFQETNDHDASNQRTVGLLELERKFSSDFVTEILPYNDISGGKNGITTPIIQKICFDNIMISELPVIDLSGNSKFENENPDKLLDNSETPCFKSEEEDFDAPSNASVQSNSSESTRSDCSSDKYDEIFNTYHTDQVSTELESEGEDFGEQFSEVEKCSSEYEDVEENIQKPEELHLFEKKFSSDFFVEAKLDDETVETSKSLVDEFITNLEIPNETFKENINISDLSPLEVKGMFDTVSHKEVDNYEGSRGRRSNKSKWNSESLVKNKTDVLDVMQEDIDISGKSNDSKGENPVLTDYKHFGDTDALTDYSSGGNSVDSQKSIGLDDAQCSKTEKKGNRKGIRKFFKFWKKGPVKDKIPTQEECKDSSKDEIKNNKKKRSLFSILRSKKKKA